VNFVPNKNQTMIEILSAIVTAFIVITATILLSGHASAKLIAATILCSIAFIYVGYSLKGNTITSIALEITVALIFYFIAVVGFVRNNAFIAGGILLHGVWDILHHIPLLITTVIPDFWPAYCLAIDIILSVYFFLKFRKLNDNQSVGTNRIEKLFK
jgi:hypothetical protein